MNERIPEVVTPAPCNTGVRRSERIIDWLSFTFPDGTPLGYVMSCLGEHGWEVMAGKHSYRQGRIRGSAQVLFDGALGMGIHVQLSGEACRDLEQCRPIEDWPTFVGELLEASASFSRVDVAIDDGSGLLDLDAMIQCVRRGEAVSRFRTASVYLSLDLPSGVSTGRTLYFGSTSSAVRVRIYELGSKRHRAAQGVRVELQARDKRARVLAQHLRDEGLGVSTKFLRGCIDFKRPGTQSVKSRRPSYDWWLEFLQATESLCWRASRSRSSIERSELWLRRQVKPTLAAFAKNPDYGPEFIRHLLDQTGE